MCMRKILTMGISLTLLLAVGGCGNDEARIKYEIEKAKLEQMEIDHQEELNTIKAISTDESLIMMVSLEHAKKEKDQAEKVFQLAKEAGLDE